MCLLPFIPFFRPFIPHVLILQIIRPMITMKVEREFALLKRSKTNTKMVYGAVGSKDMKIADSYNQYAVNNSGTETKKLTNTRDYSNYLMAKYPCLTPGKNASVSITNGLLRKAMSDEKTGAWLERELEKAPDYIKEAQQSAIAHGGTLKSVSIEFGEEYSTMTTVGVYGDEGGTDSEMDKWLERLKEKKEKQKEADKKQEEKKESEWSMEEASFELKFQGEDLEDLTNQFSRKLSENSPMVLTGYFDIKA